ncbi:helix-turn-helix domain-containing protein [Nocardioides sp. HB32]
MEAGDVVGVRGAAEILDVSVTTIYRMVERGDLRASRLRGSNLLRFSRTDLEAALSPAKPKRHG